MKLRLSVTSMAVFGTVALVVLSVGTVLFFGLGSAMQNTRRLMTDQSQTIVTTIEEGINRYLSIVDDQADWIAQYVASRGASALDTGSLNEFMLGALAATPQVAGFAIVTPDLVSRRWTRSTRDRIVESWSNRPEIHQWLEQGPDRSSPAWNTPFFTDTIDRVVLLRDRPLLTYDGEFIGMLGQIVPVASLSQQISANSSRQGVTPFILYGKEHVLAHPDLLRDKSSNSEADLPLPTLEDIDDPALQYLWADDNDDVALVIKSDNLEVHGRYLDSIERYVIYLYRQIDYFGETPWTVGVHINTDLYGGAENDRLFRALAIGILVMLLASLLAILLGRRLSKPVVAIAQTARQVEQNILDDITPLKPSTVREFDDASRAINQMVIDMRERALIRETLGRYVPEVVARDLLSEGGELSSQECDATLLYSDIVGFTSLTEVLGPGGVVDVLNAYFSEMVAILERYDGVVTQFHGDAILATFNVPVASADHAAKAVEAAKMMLTTVDSTAFSSHKVGIRIGVNTGRVIAGAVGAKGRLGYTVYGNSVNTAARLEAINKELGTRLLVSEQTATLAADEDLIAHSTVSVRGQSADVLVYTLRGEGNNPSVPI